MASFPAFILVLSTAFAAVGPIQGAPAPSATSPLEALSFLLGEWHATGSGDPGSSNGDLSFEWAADRHALLRRNVSVTSSGRHADVMLVFVGHDGDLRAVYADSEGHSIDYSVTVEVAPPRAVFESTGSGPRFRLWYRADPDGSLATGFAIAPPGASEFRTYLEGVAHRR